jgi:tryptophan 2,3-dioxygenase
MNKQYGSGAPLSYNDYLCVKDLISLQKCLSAPVHHDELLFITIHQSYELWFKQILHEIDHATEAMGNGRRPAAIRALNRIVEIEKTLVSQIHILESMTPINFLSFRDQLNPASGFQSMQFREIEFASGLKNEETLNGFKEDEYAYKRLKSRYESPSLSERYFEVLVTSKIMKSSEGSSEVQYARRVRAIYEVLTHFEQFPEEYQLAEALISHDEYFSLWRVHHIKMVERMVGSKRGTGGSEGIGYLATTLNKKFFPELWEARTLLTIDKEEHGKCPFS